MSVDPTLAARQHRITWIAVGVAIAVVMAGVGAFLGLRAHVGQSSSAGPYADGPTFHQALAEVNLTANSTSGGPWSLFSAIGLAAEAPYAPAANGLMGSGTNLSLRYCDAQLEGVTIWNSTRLPLFDGDIASGTAPFWQFAWVSTSSRQIMVATDVNGTPGVYPPMPFTNTCVEASGMANASAYYVPWLNPLPIDTILIAQNASDDVGFAFAAKHSPFVEMYNLGWTPFSNTNHGGNGAGLGVEFSRCGIVGAAGWQPEDVVGEASTGEVTNTFVGKQTCTAAYNFSAYVPYEVLFASNGTPVTAGPATTGVDLPFQVALLGAYINGSLYTDAWGLVSWMMTASLQSASGAELPVAPPSCQAWVANLSDCSANGSGWSLVLLGADGAWEASFPATPNGTGWSSSNVPIASWGSLVLLVPETWSVSGDTLSILNSSQVPTFVNSTVVI